MGTWSCPETPRFYTFWSSGLMERMSKDSLVVLRTPVGQEAIWNWILWEVWVNKCNIWNLSLFAHTVSLISWTRGAIQVSSVAQSCLTLRPHGLLRLPVHQQLLEFTQTHVHRVRCHPTISSSVVSFFNLQSSPTSGSFQMTQVFTSGGRSIGVSASASVLPVNIQDWFPLGWTGWISLLSRGLSRVFSNTTVQKHQFFSARLSL